MTRPQTPFEQVSYDLNKFRERRMAERRSVPRNTADRRAQPDVERDAGQLKEDGRDGLQTDSTP